MRPGREARARVLLVEDEPLFASMAAIRLGRLGFEVRHAGTGTDGLATADAWLPDVAVLDYELPDMNALEFLEALGHGEDPGFPVVVVSGRRTADLDHVLALDRGAAAYVVKARDMEVMLATIRRALRDHSAHRHKVAVRGMILDRRQRSVEWNGATVMLDHVPFQLLWTLATQPERPFSRDELLRIVWHTDFDGFAHSVDQAVHIIRKRLGSADCIETVFGHGYRMGAGTPER